MKMKRLERRECSKLGYALRIHVFMMLLGGLTVVLSSCEKEIPGTGSGRVKLQFVLSGNSYDIGTSEARSYGGLAPESETVVVPVGDDLYLYATLEPDLSAPLRADPETIPDETRVMVVAYKNDVYEASAQYKVSGNGLVPTTGSGLEISGSDTYTFVAYSTCSTSSVPPYPSTSPYSISVSPANDVLWGFVTKLVDSSFETISIPMQHKFSQVKVSVTAASNITTVNNVSMSPVYSSVKMQVRDGMLVDPTGSGSQSFVFSGSANTTRTSNPSLVYTAGGTFSIKIGSFATTGTPIAVSADFKHTALLSGKKYTLSLTFSRVKFAASNIYWDGSTMTFDRYTSSPTNGMQQKQGVFFKFGSLIGISAGRTVDTNHLAFEKGTNNNNDSTKTGTRLYVPYYRNFNGYVAGHDTIWTITNGAARGWDYQTVNPIIPYYGTGNSTGTNDQYDNSVIADSYNSEANWKVWKGDICQFIDPAYRLPYAYEFGIVTNRNYSDPNPIWEGIPTYSWDEDNDSKNDGTTVINQYARHKSSGYIFPASGRRQGAYSSSDNGDMDGACKSGYYNTGSSHSYSCYRVYLDEGGLSMYSGSDDLRQEGRSVRCILK